MKNEALWGGFSYPELHVIRGQVDSDILRRITNVEEAWAVYQKVGREHSGCVITSTAFTHGALAKVLIMYPEAVRHKEWQAAGKIFAEIMHQEFRVYADSESMNTVGVHEMLTLGDLFWINVGLKEEGISHGIGLVRQDNLYAVYDTMGILPLYALLPEHTVISGLQQMIGSENISDSMLVYSFRTLT